MTPDRRLVKRLARIPLKIRERDGIDDLAERYEGACAVSRIDGPRQAPASQRAKRYERQLWDAVESQPEITGKSHARRNPA